MEGVLIYLMPTHSCPLVLTGMIFSFMSLFRAWVGRDFFFVQRICLLIYLLTFYKTSIFLYVLICYT